MEVIVDKNIKFSPFLKWVGGKRRLLKYIDPLLPTSFNNYHEPMVGGGAVFFHLASLILEKKKKSFLNDLNSELILTYDVVKNDVEQLIEALLGIENSEDHYNIVRKLDVQNMSDLGRAVRFIYLNKLSYNGLYRVNQQGIYNVPYCKDPNRRIYSEDILRGASAALSKTKLVSKDYKAALKNVKKGDFVFIDPPYDDVYNKYTKDGFSREDQIKLSEEVKNLNDIGAYVMVCNSLTNLVKDLYKEFKVHKIKDRFIVNRNGSGRASIETAIITNY